MKKRMISLLLLLSMALTALPTYAFAADEAEDPAETPIVSADPAEEETPAEPVDAEEPETPADEAASDIAINETNFPDAKFLAYVASDAVDRDGSGFLSDWELSQVTKISLTNKHISTLKGIEYFTELEDLNCSRNDLTSLDLSGNTKLMYLSCYNNDLSALSVSANTELVSLDCYNNEIMALDLTHNTKLTSLDCSKNELAVLDLSKNTALTTVDCSGQQGLHAEAVHSGSKYTVNLSELVGTANIGNITSVSTGTYDSTTGKATMTTLPSALVYNYKASASVAMDVSLTLTVVQSGWVQQDGKWYYYVDGTAVTGWKQLGTAWYYFDASGVMQTGWVTLGSAKYYMASSGKMITGWRSIDGAWYYFKSSGKMTTGWLKISGSYYYFASTGKMVTGWQQVGSGWYYLDSKGKMVTGLQEIDGSWYGFGSSGKMLTGWAQFGDYWYYFASSGKAVTGWRAFSGVWYFFRTYDSGAPRMVSNSIMTPDGENYYYFKVSGVMAANLWCKDSSGYWHYFGSDGAAVSGWKTIGSNQYYFSTANGCPYMLSNQLVCTTSGSLYYLKASGALAKNYWYQKSGSSDYYYFGADGKAVSGWQTINGKTYYFMVQDGEKYPTMVHGKTITIDGKKYTFNDNGVLQ